MEHTFLKGQVSVEFMILIVIVLLYIQTVIQPSLIIAGNSVNDATRVGQARFAAEKLTNSIEFAQSTHGTTKQTIRILIPKRSYIECFQKTVPEPFDKIKMTVEIDSDVAICPSIGGSPPKYECTKEFFVLENIPMDCSFLTSNPMGDPTKNIFQQLTIIKQLDLAGEFEVIISDQ